MHKKLSKISAVILCILSICVLMGTMVIPISAINQSIILPDNKVQFDPQINIAPIIDTTEEQYPTTLTTLPPKYIGTSTDTLSNSTVTYSFPYTANNITDTLRGICGIQLYNNTEGLLTTRYIVGNVNNYNNNEYDVIIQDSELYLVNPTNTAYWLKSNAGGTLVPTEEFYNSYLNNIKKYKIKFLQNYNKTLELVKVTIKFKLCYIDATQTTNNANQTVTTPRMVVWNEYDEYLEVENSQSITFLGNTIEDMISELEYNKAFNANPFIIVKDFSIEAELTADTNSNNTADENRINITIEQPTNLRLTTTASGVNYSKDYSLYNINDADMIQTKIFTDNVVSLNDYDIVQFLINASEIFEVDIFGVVSLGEILWFIIGLSLFIVFIKLFAGG